VTRIRPGLLLLTVLAATPVRADDEAGRLALDVTHELTVEVGPRPSGGEAARRALHAIARRFEAAGLTAHEHAFTAVPMPEVAVFGKTFVPAGEALYRNGSGVNVWTIVPGLTSEVVVLGGHVDTDGPDVPGARDDGIACGLIVEAAAHARARALEKGPPRRTLVFCVFEGEERGHFGSRAFVRDRVAPGDVVLMLALDTLGSDHLALNGVGPTVDRVHAALALEAARRAGVPLSVPLPHLLFSRVLPQGERADHRSFAAAGIPAYHLFSRGPEGFDPCYHSPRDAFDRLDSAAVGATSRFLDAWLELASAAPVTRVGDAHFMPLMLPDPLGFSESVAVVLVPGLVARGIALLSLVGALAGIVAAIGRARRNKASALLSLACSLGLGVVSGGAFLAPFLVGWIVRRGPAWHAPFGRYLAAGAACVVAMLLLLALRPSLLARASGRAACLLGALALAGAAALLGALGTLEIALLPALSAAALAVLASFEGGPRRAIALLAAPGLVLLARPGLYRDGALTGTLPELGVAWIVATIAVSALLLAPTLALARTLLPPRAVGRAGAAVALLLAAILTTVAVASAPFDVEAPERKHVWDLSPRASFHAELGPASEGKRTLRVSAMTPPGSPPFDRVTILSTFPGGARVDTAAGPVSLRPGALFEVQVFGAGRDAVHDERGVVLEDPARDVTVEVEAYFLNDPSVAPREAHVVRTSRVAVERTSLR
jgi:hypothetical protein